MRGESATRATPDADLPAVVAVRPHAEGDQTTVVRFENGAELQYRPREGGIETDGNGRTDGSDETADGSGPSDGSDGSGRTDGSDETADGSGTSDESDDNRASDGSDESRPSDGTDDETPGEDRVTETWVGPGGDRLSREREGDPERLALRAVGAYLSFESRARAEFVWGRENLATLLGERSEG